MIKVIENYPVRLFRDLVPGDVFKYKSYPLEEQPAFFKLQDGYTALNAFGKELGFIQPGQILPGDSDSRVILLSSTLTLTLP